jgi:hypothetical protein
MMFPRWIVLCANRENRPEALGFPPRKAIWKYSAAPAVY